VGNLIFNSSSVDFSQVYIAFPLSNLVYNDSKLNSFFNPEFTEFIPNSGSVDTTINVDNLQQELDIVQQENTTLKNQLDYLISQNESSSSIADSMATKQVILELRKAIGQGRVDTDFSLTFPYTAIKKPTS
jgi:hypothetical protein